jgi:hypothetical protein
LPLLLYGEKESGEQENDQSIDKAPINELAKRNAA